MPGIFISYRRKESAGVSGRMFDRLSQHFGAGTVFMDIDSIPIGQDYREHIDATLAHCDLVLAVVGPQWAGPREGGRRRIDDPTDLVRLELEGGLRRKIPVVPVLIENAAMPAPEELPEALRSFAYRNAAEVDSGKDFHVHMDRLIRAIEKVVARQPAAAAEPPSPSVSPPPPQEAEAPRSAPPPRPGERAPAGLAFSTLARWYGLALGVGLVGLAAASASGGVSLSDETGLIYLGILAVIMVLVAAQLGLDRRRRPGAAGLAPLARSTIVVLVLSLAFFALSLTLEGAAGGNDENKTLVEGTAWAGLALLVAGLVGIAAQFLRPARRSR